MLGRSLLHSEKRDDRAYIVVQLGRNAFIKYYMVNLNVTKNLLENIYLLQNNIWVLTFEKFYNNLWT